MIVIDLVRNAVAGVMLVLAALTSAAAAEALPKPANKPILEIKGKISRTNAENNTAEFDRALLETIGVQQIQTSTPWTDGEPVFEGVLMRDLMRYVGASGESVTAVALNDYKVTLPASDFTKYPVLLAFKMNGEVLRVRDKGPLWIIYPQDQFPEIKDKSVHRKWVWQIKEFRVE